MTAKKEDKAIITDHGLTGGTTGNRFTITFPNITITDPGREAFRKMREQAPTFHWTISHDKAHRERERIIKILAEHLWLDFAYSEEYFRKLLSPYAEIKKEMDQMMPTTKLTGLLDE